MTAFDRDALSWFDHRTDPLLALNDIYPMADWSVGRQEIEKAFALERQPHFLSHHRGLLPNLREWQITKALKALLLESPTRTVERCQALLVALGGPTTPRLKSVIRIAADDASRMDLAIHGRGVDGTPHCIVLEAKLEAELSGTQLEKYRNALLPMYPGERQRHLWVVAPRKTARSDSILRRPENQEWQLITWRRLLIEWQRALPDEAGTEVLSLFSEIWRRIGGK